MGSSGMFIFLGGQTGQSGRSVVKVSINSKKCCKGVNKLKNGVCNSCKPTGLEPQILIHWCLKDSYGIHSRSHTLISQGLIH